VHHRLKAILRLTPLATCLLPFFLGGCGETDGYKPSAILLPAHIRRIAVRPIVNKTQYFGLEEKLRLRIEEEFIRDGRLPYVNREEESDGIVSAEIVRYIREPITYDDNHVVQEYKLWVIINLTFIEKAANAVLWEEPRMEQEYRYFVETQPGGVTEEEARELLWELFARDIVKRTIEGFGSVSGASEREVRENPIPTTDPAVPAVSTPSAGEVKPAHPATLPERTAPPSPY
jgi:hypothetical protein